MKHRFLIDEAGNRMASAQSTTTSSDASTAALTPAPSHTVLVYKGLRTGAQAGIGVGVGGVGVLVCLWFAMFFLQRRSAGET